MPNEVVTVAVFFKAIQSMYLFSLDKLSVALYTKSFV